MINEAVTKEAILIAESLIGTKEETPNRGKVIDEIQREFNFIGLPYCVIFCLHCYKHACKALSLPYPLIITASSQTLFEWAKKKGFIYTDSQMVKPGDIMIWRKWNLWSGHAGMVTSSILTQDKGISINTIEGNTSNSNFGSQSDGDGIYRRIRTANKIDFSVDGFYIRGWIDMKKVLASA